MELELDVFNIELTFFLNRIGVLFKLNWRFS